MGDLASAGGDAKGAKGGLVSAGGGADDAKEAAKEAAQEDTQEAAKEAAQEDTQEAAKEDTAIDDTVTVAGTTLTLAEPMEHQHPHDDEVFLAPAHTTATITTTDIKPRPKSAISPTPPTTAPTAGTGRRRSRSRSGSGSGSGSFGRRPHSARPAPVTSNPPPGANGTPTADSRTPVQPAARRRPSTAPPGRRQRRSSWHMGMEIPLHFNPQAAAATFDSPTDFAQAPGLGNTYDSTYVKHDRHCIHKSVPATNFLVRRGRRASLPSVIGNPRARSRYSILKF